MTVARVLLVRHGQTEWSLARRHTGCTDLPLTPTGEQQAAGLRGELGRFLPNGPDLVLTSPLLRARHTADLAGLTPYVVDPDLVEWDYGTYEGLTRTEIQQTVPDWSVWRSPCPGGESADQVRARCDRALSRIRAAGDGADVVVVAHGHLLRALTARWLGAPLVNGEWYELAAASVCVLGYEHGVAAIRHWNLPPTPPPTTSPITTSEGIDA